LILRVKIKVDDNRQVICAVGIRAQSSSLA
jgi:hypothetical protein